MIVSETIKAIITIVVIVDVQDNLLTTQNCGCVAANLLPKRNMACNEAAHEKSPAGWKGANPVAVVAAGAMGMLALAGSACADEAKHGLAAPSYPWAHDGWFSSYDHASLVFLRPEDKLNK